jgi:hypothetical protein
MTKNRLDRWALLFLGILLTGCDISSSPSGAGDILTMAVVAGRYVPTTLLLTENSETVDLLVSGNTQLEITLHPNGLTTGHFLAPEIEGVDGAVMDADLTGTWTLVGDQVRLLHEADSLIRDVIYKYENSALSGMGEDLDGRIDLEIVLTRA